MKYLDLTFPSPAENLACDEALLDMCEEGYPDEILRFWEPKDFFVVVGFANKVEVEVNVANCVSENIPVFRRCSGGGTVLQGPGCLNYSVVLRITEGSPLQNITQTNTFVMDRQREALSQVLQAPIGSQGHTDLTLNNLKFSGNAQRRRRNFLIFHGTFLLDFDIQLIERALNMPSKQPDYRQNRSHQQFLTNIPAASERIKVALKQVWQADQPMELVPYEKIQTLTETKYSQNEWNYRF